MREDCKPRPSEQLRDIFHPGNCRGLNRPKLKNRAWMFTRFHDLGFHSKDCYNLKGYGKSDKEEVATLK